MKKKTLKLAISALKKQAGIFAVDANLYETGLSDVPHAEKAYNERRELFTAIAELEAELKNPFLTRLNKKAEELIENEELDGCDCFAQLWDFAKKG